jgi:tRNA 2-(methylsulfanyl)-N6-isopentenyladenosine37 hydroxylase
VATPPVWAETALADVPALLDDHAHLEKKAALNALSLMHRWPTRGAASAARTWTRKLAAIARDETDHLGRVLRLLERRGETLSRGHKNPYAARLHRHVRAGRGQDELQDLLLVSALIEARSCERFTLLEDAAPDADLRALYKLLAASERGHGHAFLDLAHLGHEGDAIDDRWATWLEIEAEAISAQALGPRMHSGWRA